jgi:REP element-mobilizing transposase RayT
MTPPRRVLPGTTSLVTRRCSERRSFLRPSRRTNDLFLYVLAVAARRFGVLVHAFCVMSNHYHLVVTDQKGRLPAFMQYLDSLIARAMNASLGRFEGFWSSDASYSAVEPLDAGDVVAKIAYVLANPVAAGLVRSGAEWPGLWTSPSQIGSAKLGARRPKLFFNPAGTLPESADLDLTVPSGFASVEEFRSRLEGVLRELEEQNRQRRSSKGRGRRYVGVARVRAQSPFARPPTREPRFRLNPQIAAGDASTRIEGVLELKTFRHAYRRAWLARRSGVANVVFPAGTYSLRLMHGVQCAGAA